MFKGVKFLILIAFLISCEVKKDVKLQASIDKREITIGDRVKYKLLLTYPRGINLKEPDFTSGLSGFEIIDHEISKPKLKGNVWERRYTYTITTFSTGKFKILIPTITYITAGDKKKQIKQGELVINVKSVLPPNANDIKDIKFPVSIGIGWWIYLLLLIFFVLAGVVIFLFKKKKKIFVQPIPPPPPISPYELALQKLERLMKLQLIKRGKIKQYYIVLSEIIKSFLHQMYKIPILERTTSELYYEMRKANLNKKLVISVRDFLEVCDLVKFAKYLPDNKTIEDSMEYARKIINMAKENENR